MLEKKKDKIPLKKALLWILSSVIMTFIPLGLGLWYFQSLQTQKKKDPHYHITAIVQNTEGVEMLQPGYLAELLELSVDRPINLFAFDAKGGEYKLKQSPLIKDARIQKIRPNTLLVHYTPAQPVAYLVDLKNAALDTEGCIIPFIPFYPQKKLPEVYLGLNKNETEEITWGKKFAARQTQLALALLKELAQYENKYFKIKKLDVSKACSSSHGEREIVLIIEEIYQNKNAVLIKSRILRLGQYQLHQQLKRYLMLAQYRRLHNQTRTAIFDLRIPQLAFVR